MRVRLLKGWDKDRVRDYSDKEIKSGSLQLFCSAARWAFELTIGSHQMSFIGNKSRFFKAYSNKCFEFVYNKSEGYCFSV